MTTAGRSGASTSAVRQHNLGALLAHLHLRGAASRSELSAATGLNRSTIADLVHELAECGLAYEDGVTASHRPGRPSPIVHVRPRGAVVVAVDLEVESVTVATMGLGGRIFGQVREELPVKPPAPDEAVAIVARSYARLVSELPPNSAPVGVGVAVPGLTRRQDGFVHLAPNLGWSDVPFRDLLARALGQPEDRVRIANEADLGALGEHRRGAGRGFEDMVYISGEIGIGAGLVSDGSPLLGAAGYAGEAGHMLVNPEGRGCSCGARGCWETEAGGVALLRAAGLTHDAVPADLERVLTKVEHGDAELRKAAEELGGWLGVGIGNLVNLFNPEVVVLGGIYQRLFGLVQQSLVDALDGRALAPARRLVTVVAGELGPEAQLQGAAELCLADLLANPGIGLPSLG